MSFASYLVALGVAGSIPPLWLTLDILNPETFGGHRILHLEDLVGPERKTDLPSLPSPKAVLVFGARPEECGKSGLCAEVARRTLELRARGALVIGVILGSAAEVDVARGVVRAAGHPFPLALDPHGLARQSLALDGPQGFVVFKSDGERPRIPPVTRATSVARRAQALDGALVALREALGREEDRP